MTIRKYQPGDRASCIEIFQSNCPKYLDPSELSGFEFWLNGQDNEKIMYKNAIGEHYFVLEKEGKVIACGGYYVCKDNPMVSMAWGLVHNAFHKQGFGKQLFQFRVEQIIQDFPERNIELDTSQHTYRFFEKFGFKITQITKDGYGKGLDRYDMKR